MVPQAWAKSLRRHPDQRFTAWLLRGLSEGFRIGYGGGSGKRTRASRNLQSAREQPAVVDEYLNGNFGRQSGGPGTGRSDALGAPEFFWCDSQVRPAGSMSPASRVGGG